MTSGESANIRQPHPLAAALVERLRGTASRVLEIGAGRGRNTTTLQDAGFAVQAVADADAQSFIVPASAFDAAIGTHAFLHGTPQSVRQMVNATARALKAGAPFYCAFGSKQDARFRQGVQVCADTFAPESGDEAGVAHAYFDEAGVRAALGDAFVIESLTEQLVDDVVGSWAHAKRPSGRMHWFLRARRAQ